MVLDEFWVRSLEMHEKSIFCLRKSKLTTISLLSENRSKKGAFGAIFVIFNFFVTHFYVQNKLAI